MDVKSNRKTYREKSIKVLEQYESSRNSDWSFLFKYLESEGLKIPKNIQWNIAKSGISMHTILRERQKIQSEGLFLPTNPDVIKRRKKLSEEYREAYKN